MIRTILTAALVFGFIGLLSAQPGGKPNPQLPPPEIAQKILGDPEAAKLIWPIVVPKGMKKDALTWRLNGIRGSYDAEVQFTNQWGFFLEKILAKEGKGRSAKLIRQAMNEEVKKRYGVSYYQFFLVWATYETADDLRDERLLNSEDCLKFHAAVKAEIDSITNRNERSRWTAENGWLLRRFEGGAKGGPLPPAIKIALPEKDKKKDDKKSGSGI